MSQIELIHKAFLSCDGVITDSRKCTANTMFFALKGERFDGNQYVKDVLANGVAYAVADDKQLRGLDNVFLVEDVLQTLQDLALFHRRYLNLPIIAITGTNGKTTSKELVSAVLAEKYKVKATSGNFNNHIGVPLTLLSMDKTIELGVVEMGANHIGEIGFLCSIAEPNFGLITNVGKAHLEGFGSFEGVKIAKGELYKYLLSNKGKVFINSDNEHLKGMAEGVVLKTQYGTKSGKIVGHVVQNSPYVTAEWNMGKDTYKVQTNLIGEYNLENILCAICIGNEFGVSPKAINKALEAYQPTNNRSQFIESAKNKIIMDAYNANPSSMQVALENFSNVESKNKVVILGGMKELGVDSEVEHEKLLIHLQSTHFDKVILIGEEFKIMQIDNDQFEVYDTSKQVGERLVKAPLKDAYILIKGSRSNQLEDLLDYL